MKEPEDAGNYQVDNDGTTQGQVIGDYATVHQHFHPPHPTAPEQVHRLEHVWTVPQQQNMFFTGREDVLRTLEQFLVPGKMATLTQALSGLGGTGKTATAIEYAYRFRTSYETVLWMQADSWSMLTSECVKLANELGLPECDEQDQNLTVEAVKRWLRKHHHWLLILDNVEDPQRILQFVPSGHQGSVLITTRVQDIEPLGQTQILATMSESEGILFLLRRTKRLAYDAQLKQTSMEQYHEAQQIWKEMDGLPLALDQAGAYILETKCSFASYQEKYAHRRKELLQRRGKRYIGHEMSVAATFSLALERIEEINPIAADILRTCSMLHAEAIPEELFQKGAAYLGPRLAANPDGWDEAVGILCDYSLVQQNTESHTLTVHRLVQAVLKDALQAEETKQWAERAVLAMYEAFPEIYFETRQSSQRYIAHAEVCAKYINHYKMLLPEALFLLTRIGKYWYDRAVYKEALQYSQMAKEIAEVLWGNDHLFTSTIMQQIAEIQEAQGNYKEALQWFKKALQVAESVGEKEHLTAMKCMRGIALVYRELGEYSDALWWYEQVLLIMEKNLGKQHPDTLKTLHQMAMVYRKQGMPEHALPFYKNILAILETTVGEEHPDTAAAMQQLAAAYRDLGQLEEALYLFQKALTIKEEVLGIIHPSTAAALQGIATIYHRQGKYAEALEWYQNALQIKEKTLGNTHINTAMTVLDIATNYIAQGKLDNAYPFYLRALDIYEQVLGIEHRDTLTTARGLITLLEAQGKSLEAVQLHQRYSYLIE